MKWKRVLVLTFKPAVAQAWEEDLMTHVDFDGWQFIARDVILQLEPKLFERVTGLSKQDFALLVSLNVFNEALMNDAVYKFKRYEDASLSYAGIDRHESDNMVGGYSTVITRQEFFAQ